MSEQIQEGMLHLGRRSLSVDCLVKKKKTKNLRTMVLDMGQGRSYMRVGYFPVPSDPTIALESHLRCIYPGER